MARRAHRVVEEEDLYQVFVKEEKQIKNKTTDLRKIEPLTENQRRAFAEYEREQHIILNGAPGTGKTFIAIYLALRDVLLKKYLKLIIVRSAVASRSIGYLPGTIEEKTDVYKAPYVSICNELFGYSGAFDMLVKKGIIEFTTTSFLRGLTFDYSIVLADELQNFSFAEIDTLVTRTGKESRLIFSGDYEQRDLRTKNDQSGLNEFLDIAETMDEISIIDFGIEDIVRSGFVKNYIIAKLKMENNDY